MPIALRSTDPEEQYANAFAFALLMPESAVRKLHREGHSVVILAYKFGVPADVMAHRLRGLGLLRDTPRGTIAQSSWLARVRKWLCG